MEKIKAIVIAAILVATIGTAVVLMPVQAAELSGELTIAGSTTVLPINQECARLLMEENHNLRISVSGGGSGHGVKAVGEGAIDIGAVSRDVKSKEMETYPDLKPVAIGKDSVAIVVHQNNDVNELTMEQAAKILCGDITNWKDVGGPDCEIRVITREGGSGTRDCFENSVMKPFDREITGKALVKPSNGDIRAAVSRDEGCISYVSFGFVDTSLKAVKIDGVEASVENVLSGDYPISRSLYLLTKGEPDELKKAFIDFVLSEEGQQVVEDMGYIRVPAVATPAPTPAATPIPTQTAEVPSETTQTPAATPGFEAVFAIAGLFAYVVLKRRK